MGKRRAVLVHEVPRKKPRAAPGAWPDRARDEPVPAHVHKRTRSPVHEPPRKHTADRDSGSASAPVRSPACTERARTEVPLAGNEDGELGEYNSFQFWRDPLPALDLTLLDDPSAPGSPRRDAPEAMET